MLGFQNDWLAWQIDTGVGEVGRWLEAKLSERDKKGKLKNKPSKVLRYKPRVVQSVDELILALGGRPEIGSVIDIGTEN